MASKQSNVGKVDISAVNKKRSVLKLDRIKSLFTKKTDNIRRDAEGRFTAGSGGLLTDKKLNKKRIIPVVAVVALLGGYLVFQSFAATGNPPAYQYSIHSCTNMSLAKIDISKINTKEKKCLDESAEALAFRMQFAVAGTNGNKFPKYVQQLAGDRTTQNEVAVSMVDTDFFRWNNISTAEYVRRIGGLATKQQQAAWVKELEQHKLSREQLATNIANLFKLSPRKHFESTFQYNNKEYVSLISKRLLAKEATGNNSWVRHLDAMVLSRAEILARMARTEEAIQKSRVNMLKFVASKPKIKIVQTAKAIQTARGKSMAKLANDATIHYEKGVNYHATIAKRNVDGAKRQYDARPVTAAHVQAAKNVDREVKDHLRYARESAANAEKVHQAAKGIYQKAKSLSNYATDIPSANIEANYNKTVWYAAVSKNKVKETQVSVDTVSQYVSGTIGKFNAQQKKLAEEASRKKIVESTRGQSRSSAPILSNSQMLCSGKSIAACEAEIRKSNECVGKSIAACEAAMRKGSECSGKSIAACEAEIKVKKRASLPLWQASINARCKSISVTYSEVMHGTYLACHDSKGPVKRYPAGAACRDSVNYRVNYHKSTNGWWGVNCKRL